MGELAVRSANRNANMGGCATMRQTNEVGASICQKPNGQYVFGPKATGTPTSVNVPVSCPAGSKFVGIYHTHPGGIPVPSPMDLTSGRSVNAKLLCIKVPETGQTRCYVRK